MSGSQQGKVAVVTGATANLGKLFSTSLAEDGATVVAHYNSPSRKDEADATVADLEKLGVEAMSFQADLTRTGNVTALVDATIERFGHGMISPIN